MAGAVRNFAEAIGGCLTRRTFLAGSAAAALATKAGGEPGGNTPPPARDLRLWYAQPAGSWEEALPVGNGRIGAMVFGGVGTERLQLNEDTLWSGGPYVDRSLTIPHPLFRERDFVLGPASAIAPHWRDPVTGLTLRQLHARLTRKGPLRR